ncbi:MAG: hypothetical protein GXO66_02815 [Euryarchaeota archaeon]|nr:hypothetical protein [Euryarchaeota archaeon]
MRTLAVLLILLLLGCTAAERPAEPAQPETPPAPPASISEQVKTYRSEALRFEVSYPASWRVVEDKVGEEEIVFFLAPRGSYGTANINVAKEEANQSLAEYVSAMKANAAELLSNYTVLKENGRQVSGQEAYELVYTYVQGPYTIKNHAVFVKAGGGIYLITLASMPEEFEKNEEIFERFLESFKAW